LRIALTLSNVFFRLWKDNYRKNCCQQSPDARAELGRHAI
jgi:hypothetical protein